MKKNIKRIFLRTVLRRNLPLSLQPHDFTPTIEIKEMRDVLGAIDRIPCNLNFDDQCPVSSDHLGRDFGGDLKDGLAVEFKKFLEECPYVAVTSFVIPHYLGNKKGKEKNKLSHQGNQNWLAFYNDLSEQYNIEYALHGCYHYQKEVPFFARHTEFAFKNENEAHDAVCRGMQIFEECGWQVSGFRQPGWDINSDISICRILNKIGLDYIAGSSLDAGFNSGSIERVSNHYPTVINGLINFPQNIELDWEIERIKREIDRLYKLRALISIEGHFVNKGVCNCLDGKNLKKLDSIVKYINGSYADRVDFITFTELAKKIKYECRVA